MPLSADVQNRFTLIYGLWTGAFLLFVDSVDELDMAFNLWILVIPIIALPAILLLTWFVIALGIGIVRHRWRRVASVLLGPPLLAVAILLLLHAGFDASWLRFEFHKRSYLRDVAIRSGGTSGLVVWPWGETGGAATENSFYTLVYDESDRLNDVLEHRSGPGNDGSPSVLSGAVAPSEDQRPLVSVRHLDGHFYLVCEIYQ